MSKRINENQIIFNSIKKQKITRTNNTYVNISINDSLFYEYSLDELSEFSNEIKNVINKLNNYKDKIDSVLRIYC